MALLDLLGRRWQLRLLWELRDDRHLRFRALQELRAEWVQHLTESARRLCQRLERERDAVRAAIDDPAA